MTYFWSGPAGFASQSPEIWLLQLGLQNAGYYSVTVADTFGCSISDSVLIAIYGYPIFGLGNDTVICVDSLGHFMLQVNPSYSNYLWHNGSTDSYLNVLDTGFFHLTVDVSETCFKSDTIHIGTRTCLPDNPYNVITPNGDGINDFFVIKDLEFYPNSKLTIYNRWGLIIYETDDYKNNWDGANHSDGTYYYICYPNDSENRVESLTGYLTLLRNHY